MEHHIIYISTAEHLMSKTELLHILERSRDWNNSHGITGMLIYIEGLFIQPNATGMQQHLAGRFMQVLEGSKAEVEALFASIQTDVRHQNLIVLENAPVASRDFESWQMGFSSLSLAEFEANPGYFALDASFLTASKEESSNRALQFLQSFYHRGKSQSALFP